MLKKALRIQAIAQEISQNPTYTVRNLAKKYQVSEMTVRRDIQYIEENMLTNSATKPVTIVSAEMPDLSGNSSLNYEFTTAMEAHNENKRRIGAYAAKMVQPNDVIILDTGTTVNFMVESLPFDMPLTIICYNYNVLQKLYDRPNIHLIVAGGYFHRSSLSFESTENIELLQRLRASKIFISPSGVDRMGLTCSNQYEVTTKSTALHSSKTKILLSDSSKFGIMRSSLFAPLEEMDVIISDHDLSAEWQQYLQKKT
ncbi:MAG: DeoR/GlpR family DNA-binding transcription regulator [Eubacterium sp.]|nr:DeoR/GlpR family DNA-binding transcription regulator [Eubacterium sp.]